MNILTSRRAFLKAIASTPAGVSMITASTATLAQTAQVSPEANQSSDGGSNPIVQTEAFDHVCLSARDLEGTANWYKRVFGFQETHRFELPDYVGVEAELVYLRLGNTQLEIFGNANAKIGRPEPMSFPETIAYTGFQHFCMRVDDMDATIEALKAAGIPIFLGPNTNAILNRTFIHIKDPEGNDVEIVKWEK